MYIHFQVAELQALRDEAYPSFESDGDDDGVDGSDSDSVNETDTNMMGVNVSADLARSLAGEEGEEARRSFRYVSCACGRMCWEKHMQIYQV